MKKYIIGVGIFAALMFFVFMRNPEQTTSEYAEDLVERFNSGLEDPNSDILRRVENAHGTVTVTSAKVTGCRVATIDGTDNAGKKGGNVSEVTLEITFRWDGIIDKNGYTKLQMVIQNDSLIKSEIVETSALINFEDLDFWCNVGWAIGACFY